MYEKQVWEDGTETESSYITLNDEKYYVVPATVVGGTSITSEKLNYMEDGIAKSYTYTDDAIKKAITDVLESEY